MTFGNKLVFLRKQNKMTQEQLANELKITRQTVSNWELNQTSPDLEQIKSLSNLYKISIDELVDNNIKEILTDKVSNIEKLAGLTYKVLKFLLISIIVFIFGFIIWKVLSVNTYAWFIGMTYKYECTLNDKKYVFEVIPEKENFIDDMSGKAVCCKDGKIIDIVVTPYIAIPKLEEQGRLYQSKNLIYSYFEQNDGSCNEYYSE